MRIALVVLLAACGDNQAPHASVDSDHAASQNGGGCYPTGTTAQMFDMITLTDPEWAPVVDGQKVDSTPVYVHGVANRAHGDTGGDFPFTHLRPDVTAEITPDPEDSWRLATGNFTGDDGDAPGVMEFEWENGAYPQWAIPGDGDRMVVFGRWIFDCGHSGATPGQCAAAPDTACVLDADCASGDHCIGQHFNYASEIHPPQGAAVLRQGRGAILVDGGEPVPATRADVFVSPNGGAASDRCVLTHQRVADLVLDEQCFPLFQPITPINSYDFTFDIPLPPRPQGAHAIWRAVGQDQDLFGGVPAAVVVTVHEDGASPHLSVVVKMTQRTAAGLPTGYAATIFGGWAAPADAALVHVRVTVDAIEIANPLKPLVPVVRDVPGWRMQAAVNGEWQALAGLDAVHAPGTIGEAVVFDQYLPADGAVHIVANGVSSACIDTLYGTNISDVVNQLGFGAGVDCLTTSNPHPGTIDATYSGPSFGAGSHEVPAASGDGGFCSTTTTTACVVSTDCPGTETCAPSPAYSLRYRIELPLP